MILTHRFVAGDRHFDLELHGPHDSMLWGVTLNNMNMGPTVEAAVIGSGVDIRSAAEASTRALLKTPYTEYRETLANEVQEWLRGLPNADARQGDVLVKVYAILKVLR